MFAIRSHAVVGMLVILLFGGCASSPRPETATVSQDSPNASKDRRAPWATAADSPELISLKLDSSLPLAGIDRSDNTLLAGDVQVGIDADRLTYSASYALNSGDVFSHDETATPIGLSPSRFGGQRIGQNITLTLPELGGAPMSLGVSSEFQNAWLVTGYTQSQRQRAHLRWAPGPAAVDVNWTAGGVPFDASMALSCDVLGTVRWPTHEGRNHSEGIVLTGGDCAISTADTLYTGIETETWGLGYVWTGPARESKAVLSVVEPVWAADSDYRNIDPGYELGFSHRRQFGPLSARALVTFRQPSTWETALPLDSSANLIAADASWATNTSVTWKLPDASLSANWAQGSDSLWFTPQVGQRRDNFGLALNMSRWIEEFLPKSSPQFAMNWNWSRIRMPDDQITADKSLRLNLALMF